MKYIHGIVVVNRADLLALAVQSVEALWPWAFILDNSEDGRIGRERAWPVPVVRPSVPLSCAQAMNYLHRLAKEAGADVFGYQHDDAEAQSGSAERYWVALQDLAADERKWAVMFTHYDILSAYPVAAVDDIGPWDTAFPQPNYHIDNDWFHRARLKGYELIDTGIPVTHHGDGSQTVRSSPRRAMINNVTFPMNNEYYCRKWGGPPEREVYRRPWNVSSDDHG